MKKNPNPKLTRCRLSARALQLLALHVNTHGEISSGLEAALSQAGPKASVVTIPAKTLTAFAVEGSALLIKGKVTFVWCARGDLGTIVKIARSLGAEVAANWIGHLAVKDSLDARHDQNATQSPTSNAIGEDRL
jgi:hypothetical protein